MADGRLLGIINPAKLTPEELEELLKPIILPRKTSELEIKPDHPLLLGIENLAKDIFNDIISRYKDDDKGREEQNDMDRHWAAQEAAFNCFTILDKGYHEFLPGRLYMYEQLAHRILRLWNKSKRDLPRRSLELGCGSATLSNILASSGEFTADAIDLSLGALRYAEHLATSKYGFGTEEYFHAIESDMFSYETEKQYSIIMNSGVFEHLTTEEQKKLIKRMAALVCEGGLVVVAVPNVESPLVKAAKETEERRSWYDEIRAYLYPQPYKDRVDLDALFKHAGLSIIEHSGVSLVPSALTKNLCKKTVDLYSGRIGRCNDSSDVATIIRNWENFEYRVGYENSALLEKYGRYKYAIGLKE